MSERVAILASFYCSQDIPCFPNKMKFNNEEIVFESLKSWSTTEKNGHKIHVFEMNDSIGVYRLEFDPTILVWTLANDPGQTREA